MNCKDELQHTMECFLLKICDIKWAWVNHDNPHDMLKVDYYLKENPDRLEISNYFMMNDFLYENAGPYFVNGVVMFNDGSFLKRVNKLYGIQHWDYFKMEMPLECKRILRTLE